MEAYVDGKLRMKQEWFNIEIFDIYWLCQKLGG